MRDTIGASVTGQWVYTSVDSGRWRVLKVGDRVDAPFSFKTEPKKSWARLVSYVQQRKK